MFQLNIDQFNNINTIIERDGKDTPGLHFFVEQ
jgi:hypothetical protein